MVTAASAERLFYPFGCVSKQGAHTIFLIPIKLFSREVQDRFLLMSSQEDELPPLRNDRIRFYSDNFEDWVIDEVVSATPHFKLSKMTAKLFAVNYPNAKVIATAEVEINSGRKLIPGVGKFFFKRFIDKSFTLINRFREQIFPNESFRLVWDMISQIILRNQNFTQEDTSGLSLRLIQYWEGVFSKIDSFVDLLKRHIIEADSRVKQAQELASVNAFLKKLNANATQAAIAEARNNAIEAFDLCNVPAQTTAITAIRNELNNFTEFVQDLLPGNSQHFLEEMHQMVTPFLYFFDVEMKISRTKHAYCQIISSTLYMRLEDFQEYNKEFNIPVLLRKASSAEYKQRIILRNEMLALARQLPIKHFVEYDEVLRMVDEIPGLFEKKDWLEAYKKIEKAVDLFVSTFKLLENKDSFDGNAQTQYARILHFLRGLKNDFEYLVKEKVLHDLISSTALEEMKKANQCLNMPLQPVSIGSPFKEWATNLAKRKYKAVTLSAKAMFNSWSKLKEIKSVIEGGEFQRQFAELCFAIESATMQEVVQKHSDLEGVLMQSIMDWKKELKILNQSIEDVVSAVFVALTDSELPQIDLQTLKNNFLEFNRRMDHLIKPMNQLVNGFENLICLDLETSSIQDSEKEEEAIDDLKLVSFPTDGKFFGRIKELQQKTLQGYPISFEIESSSIEDHLKDIFAGSQKSRKVFKNLRDFLDENNIPYGVLFGKGDHKKLFIGGGLAVVLPEHKTWKPGTVKSMENQSIVGVANYINQKAKRA